MTIQICKRCDRERLIAYKRLCHPCAVTVSRQKTNYKRSKISSVKWNTKNPDYHKEYYQEHKEKIMATAFEHYYKKRKTI